MPQTMRSFLEQLEKGPKLTEAQLRERLASYKTVPLPPTPHSLTDADEPVIRPVSHGP